MYGCPSIPCLSHSVSLALSLRHSHSLQPCLSACTICKMRHLRRADGIVRAFRQRRWVQPVPPPNPTPSAAWCCSSKPAAACLDASASPRAGSTSSPCSTKRGRQSICRSRRGFTPTRLTQGCRSTGSGGVPTAASGGRTRTARPSPTCTHRVCTSAASIAAARRRRTVRQVRGRCGQPCTETRRIPAFNQTARPCFGTTGRPIARFATCQVLGKLCPLKRSSATLWSR